MRSLLTEANHLKKYLKTFAYWETQINLKDFSRSNKVFLIGQNNQLNPGVSLK